MNVNKAIESIMGKLPDMDKLMPGYEFKDGKLKPIVDYWATDDSSIIPDTDVIILKADKSVLVPSMMPIKVETQITLHIKAPSVMFNFFLLHPHLASVGTNIVTVNTKEPVSFLVQSNTGHTVSVPKGAILGYGFFQPIIPINNIALTKQDAAS